MKSTSEFVREWRRAIERLAEAKRRHQGAETELLNAANELGKHLIPDDARNGERFAVWVRIGHKDERLVVVTRAPSGDYDLQFRSGPRPVAKDES